MRLPSYCRQDKLSQDIARIEQTHGEKLPALFDIYQSRLYLIILKEELKEIQC